VSTLPSAGEVRQVYFDNVFCGPDMNASVTQKRNAARLRQAQEGVDQGFTGWIPSPDLSELFPRDLVWLQRCANL
jgi:hypothetical protein